MAKPTSRFVCQACGAVTAKWAGKCETCGEWNTIAEEATEARPGPTRRPGAKLLVETLAGTAEPPPRRQTGIGELDRVLGGGLVAASAVLVGVCRGGGAGFGAVRDFNAELAVVTLDVDGHLGAGRVPAGVGQCFLDDPVGAQADRSGHVVVAGH